MDDDPAPTKGALSQVKLPFPPEFTGIFKRDHLDVQDWVTIVKDHLLLREISVQSAAAIQFSRLFLRGPALVWAQTNGMVVKPQNFTNWSEALTAAFMPIAKKELARDKLKAIKHWKSCEMYCDLFRRQARDVKDMSKTDVVDLFLDNLKPALRSLVRIQLIGKAKDDLDLAINTAVVIDNERQKDRRASTAGPSTSTASAKAVSPAGGSSQPRRCFNCGATDHLKNTCPHPRKAQGQKGNGYAGASKGKAKLKAVKADSAQENE